jgi:hypothetical protein
MKVHVSEEKIPGMDLRRRNLEGASTVGKLGCGKTSLRILGIKYS